MVAQTRFQFCLCKSFKAESNTAHPTEFLQRLFKDTVLKYRADSEVRAEVCAQRDTHIEKQINKDDKDRNRCKGTRFKFSNVSCLTNEEVPFSV